MVGIRHERCSKLILYDDHGFSLTELIIVMVIMGIMLSLVSMDFHSMQKDAFIEKQTREFASDVSNLRMLAMTRKLEHSVTINQNGYVFKRYSSNEPTSAGTEILNKTYKYQFCDKSGLPYDGASILINDQGFSYFGNTVVVGPADSSASVNCVVISSARVNLGKMNGANCVYK